MMLGFVLSAELLSGDVSGQLRLIVDVASTTIALQLSVECLSTLLSVLLLGAHHLLPGDLLALLVHSESFHCDLGGVLKFVPCQEQR